MITYTALTTIEGEDPAYALSEDLEVLAPEPTGTGVFEMLTIKASLQGALAVGLVLYTILRLIRR